MRPIINQQIYRQLLYLDVILFINYLLNNATIYSNIYALYGFNKLLYFAYEEDELREGRVEHGTGRVGERVTSYI